MSSPIVSSPFGKLPPPKCRICGREGIGGQWDISKGMSNATFECVDCKGKTDLDFMADLIQQCRRQEIAEGLKIAAQNTQK